MIPNMDVLGSLVRDIHSALYGTFYLALPVAMMLSVAIAYFQTGSKNERNLEMSSAENQVLNRKIQKQDQNIRELKP